MSEVRIGESQKSEVRISVSHESEVHMNKLCHTNLEHGERRRRV